MSDAAMSEAQPAANRTSVFTGTLSGNNTLTIDLANPAIAGKRLKRATIEANGTWDGGTIALQDSVDGTNYRASVDGTGAALTIAADGNTQWVEEGFGPYAALRASMSGAGGSVAVAVTVRADWGD